MASGVSLLVSPFRGDIYKLLGDISLEQEVQRILSPLSSLTKNQNDKPQFGPALHEVRDMFSKFLIKLEEKL